MPMTGAERQRLYRERHGNKQAEQRRVLTERLEAAVEKLEPIVQQLELFTVRALERVAASQPTIPKPDAEIVMLSLKQRVRDAMGDESVNSWAKRNGISPPTLKKFLVGSCTRTNKPTWDKLVRAVEQHERSVEA